MNLFWLKYVSYALLAGAGYFYFVLRTNSLASLSRPIKIAFYALCIISACVAWHVQESSANQHSPRKLIIGSVSSVSANHHKSGSINDDFQLRLDGGSLSPKFSTDTVADNEAGQPIHQGDTLGVLYRTWDDVILTIDEIQGQRQGWHYRRYEDGSSLIVAVSVVGSFMLIGVLVGARYQRPATPTSEPSTLNLNG